MPYSVKHQTASQHQETVTLFGQACGLPPWKFAKRQRFECFSLRWFSDRNQKCGRLYTKRPIWNFFWSGFNTLIQKIEISICPTGGVCPVSLVSWYTTWNFMLCYRIGWTLVQPSTLNGWLAGSLSNVHLEPFIFYPPPNSLSLYQNCPINRKSIRTGRYPKVPHLGIYFG